MRQTYFYGSKSANSEDSGAIMDQTQSADSSLGLGGDFSAVLNDSNYGDDILSISISGFAELLDKDKDSVNDSVNGRPSRSKKERDYNEGNSDISGSDDDKIYSPSEDEDGENQYVPHKKKKKKSENNGGGNVLQSTPKQKGPG